MRKFLIFRLYGHLGSWGDIAVGEVRPTFAYPTKSGILGLLAAAMGIRREESEKHAALRNGYNFAVKVLGTGTALRDYHTIQRPSASGTGCKKKTYSTRRDELADKELLNCTQSTRDYHTDALFVVAVWMRTAAPSYSLTEIATHLKTPSFCLYLGRKSCPPALPLYPQVVASPTLREAFQGSIFPDRPFVGDLLRGTLVQVYWEGDVESGYEGSLAHIVTRRDDPVDRIRWQFAERNENYATESGGDEPCFSVESH
jgi:CRISPR system Cascade subunit CasD